MRKYLFVIAVLFFAGQTNAQSGYKIVNTFHIKSGGGWDYIAVHVERLYVSHGTQVNILDKKTGVSLGVIPGTTGIHGIAFDDALGRGYTSNGRLNNVFVFDLETNKILDSVKTGTNPDAIMFEPFSKMIITCNGRSNDLSLIDPQTNKLAATIAVGGKPETAVSDGNGKLFVNIEDKNEIALVDLKTMKMISTWPLDGGEEPTGLVYDATSKRLFAGCDKLLVILDATSGNVVSKIPIGEGCDGVAFDNASKTIFTANGQEGTITVIKEKSANDFSVVENVPTKKGARTITIDESTHTLYLPTAEFEANTPKGQWPKMIPGTFMVLVVSK
ncbi:YncE family protein [Panacibacter ginsenosidivorans]|uniref:YncE family protein n=1 Tax=Panacibacter ginsenosidivorans TaxID=1813871 RepID=A0A5B8V3Q7_9BACT|nr:YncE family protein [Panacibacter ginsenosidivorans]QEC66060.1 YncE family protein [Panacibacter ginsenosidivorans]